MKKNLITGIVVALVIIAVIFVGIFAYISSITIGKAEAKRIALSHQSIPVEEVSAMKADLDYDDGIWKYEVKFYWEYIEYSYEIDARNGNIITFDIGD